MVGILNSLLRFICASRLRLSLCCYCTAGALLAGLWQLFGQRVSLGRNGASRQQLLMRMVFQLMTILSFLAPADPYEWNSSTSPEFNW